LVIDRSFWMRRQLIGWIPIRIVYGAYRTIRRIPRLYLLMRAFLMREMAGRSK